MTPERMNPLRRRMIEDMMVRGHGEKTKLDYIRAIRRFAAFLGRSPDTATAEDLRAWQLHMTETNVSVASFNQAITVLRFFFTVTCGRGDLVRNMRFRRAPQRLPVTLSPEEVARLIEAAPGAGLKYKAALSIAYGAGLRTSEVVNLKIGDIDSDRMLIRVEQGKGRKDRHVMLSPHLLELLRDYWREARPQGGPCRSRCGRDRQARLAAHAPAQLRHPSPRGEHRHPGDPGAARARQARHHREVCACGDPHHP
jgi:integrase